MTDQELIQNLLEQGIFKNMSRIAAFVGVSPTQISRVRKGTQSLRPTTRDWLLQKLQTSPRSDKPILCLDFDGIIHSYVSGWKGATIIPDPPVAGAFEFIKEALQYFEVAIFSSRSAQPGGIAAMQEWFLRYGWPQDQNQNPQGLFFPVEKPAAFLTIDDRAITFTGLWPDARELRKFKPWYQTRKPIIAHYADDVPFGLK